MKEFNLEEYIKDPTIKIITRNGLPVRIISIDRQHVKYTIVALVLLSESFESLCCYLPSGRYEDNKVISEKDLMFLV